MTATDSQILAAYERIESNEPDISTERLLWHAAQDCNCDVSDVCDALYRHRDGK